MTNANFNAVDTNADSNNATNNFSDFTSYNNNLAEEEILNFTTIKE